MHYTVSSAKKSAMSPEIADQMQVATIQVEYDFSELFEIIQLLSPGVRTTALIGRVKRWVQLGMLGASSGRGRKALYDLNTIWRACIISEMHSLGLTPEAIKALIGDRSIPYGCPIQLYPVAPHRNSSITIDTRSIQKVIEDFLCG